ncbi:MAG: sugar-binding transcriptional regulator [Rhizobiales bacterium]|nr:sugar-binding transcriptional regulator [Hyphomicrobiales bacterium]OJY07545.1 MAG: LacI family transcriptional regulator [Rhizobiales bacterium 63-22]
MGDLLVGSEGVAAENRTSRLRTRAAWMYYIEQMTQNDIAEALGVGRVTIVRLLADARARNEVKITIEGRLSALTALEVALEKTFGLEHAVVAPLSTPGIDPIPPISAATGAWLSEQIAHGMRIGVGWGRTLSSTLQHIGSRPVNDLKVISLLGGIVQPRRSNPPEFAWQFAQLLQGEGYLIPAPALVDSAETRTALIDRCGLRAVLDMAENLDMVLLSVGGIETASSTSYRVGLIDEKQKQSLIANGAVGDVLFHFYDREGRVVDDPVHDRVMSARIESLQNTRQRILTSGGREKIEALLGAMKLLRPTVFITDEESAAEMLRRAS